MLRAVGYIQSMPIEITPEVEQLVEGILSQGRYSSQAEVLTNALRLLSQREQLRQDLEKGMRQLAEGQRLGANEVFAELRQRIGT